MAANTVPIHSELPPATHDTPYGLQILLDMFREQYLKMLRLMRTDDFRKNVEIQIIDEKVRVESLFFWRVYSMDNASFFYVGEETKADSQVGAVGQTDTVTDWR